MLAATLETIDRRLTRDFSSNSRHHSTHMPMARAYAGIETVTGGAGYFFDGMKRGLSKREPHIAIQFTLSGAGCFQNGPAREKNPVETVGAGKAFICSIPSEHRYWLPKEAGPWRFLWILFFHPYASSRIITEFECNSPVVRMPPEAPLTRFIVDFASAIALGRIATPYDLERLLCHLAIEIAWHLRDGTHYEERPTELLRSVQEFLRRSPDRYFAIKEIAAEFGYSRGHFTHIFRQATGMTPARYILQLRIEEARLEMIKGESNMGEIARKFGFTDASHLRNSFRRVFAAGVDTSRPLKRDNRTSAHHRYAHMEACGH